MHISDYVATLCCELPDCNLPQIILGVKSPVK